MPSDRPTNDWGASEVHDWGVPPPSDSAWDPFGPKYESGDVTYDLGSWTEEQRETLMIALNENGIPYDFDGRLLTVAQDDEMDVDALVAGEELPNEDDFPDETNAVDVAKSGLLMAIEVLAENL